MMGRMGAAPLPLLMLVLEFARAEQAEDPWGFRFVPQDYFFAAWAAAARGCAAL
jgi:hypothetical protein